MSAQRLDEIRAFLKIYAVRCETTADLFARSLSDLSDEKFRHALTTWLRTRKTRPTPFDLIFAAETMEARSERTMREIAERVCEARGVSMTALMSEDRTQRVAYTRHEIMFRARRAGFTLNQVGRFLKRDRTSVIHGERAHVARAEGEG